MKTILCTLFFFWAVNMAAQTNDMIIRIAGIEIDSSYLQEYNRILHMEAKASVEKEPGVIAIFPMYQKENQTRFIF